MSPPPASAKPGTVKYGPGVVSLTYQFAELGAVKPYGGAGPAYLAVFASKHAGINSFRVKRAWGWALALGVDVDLTPRYAAFIDLKKLFVNTEVTGAVPAFGGVPVNAKARVEPRSSTPESRTGSSHPTSAPGAAAPARAP